MTWCGDHSLITTVAYNRISNRQLVKFAAVESDRDGAVMHIPEAGVYFGEGQLSQRLRCRGSADHLSENLRSTLLRCHRSADPFCKVGKHGVYLPLSAILAEAIMHSKKFDKPLTVPIRGLKFRE